MNPWISHAAIGILSLALGLVLGGGIPTGGSPTTAAPSPSAAPSDETTTATATPPETPSEADGARRAPGVTGIGGIFFKSPDPEGLRAWYRDRLDLGVEEGTSVFQWRDQDDPAEIGYTVWGIFPSSTTYFDPTTSEYMLNFRVADLTELLVSLREAGVEVAGDVEEHPNGRFAWIVDPEGRKIELWEPVPSDDDPYLR